MYTSPRRILLTLFACYVGSAVALDVYGNSKVRPVDGSAWGGAVGSDVADPPVVDAVVVAGCRVAPGGVASLCLRQRTVRAVEVWRNHPDARLVLTGGVGVHPPSEAAVAAEIAREMGVPERALRVEDLSTSTEENARFAAAHVAARRVIVVSDGYHLLRVRRVFLRYFDVVDVVGVTPPLWPRIRGALREVAAIGAYLMLGRW